MKNPWVLVLKNLKRKNLKVNCYDDLSQKSLRVNLPKLYFKMHK
jgi:hypothetical protein